MEAPRDYTGPQAGYADPQPVYTDPKPVLYGGGPFVISDFVGSVSPGTQTAALCTEEAVAQAVIVEFQTILKGAAANWPQTLRARVKITKPEFPNDSGDYVLQQLLNRMAAALPQGFVARVYCDATKQGEHEYVLYYHPAEEEKAWQELYQQQIRTVVSKVYRAHDSSGRSVTALLPLEPAKGLVWNPRGMQDQKIPGAAYECLLMQSRVEPHRTKNYTKTVTEGVLSVINSAPGLTACIGRSGEKSIFFYELNSDQGKLTILQELKKTLLQTVVAHLQPVRLPGRLDEWWWQRVSITIDHASIPILVSNHLCSSSDFVSLADSVWTDLGFPPDKVGPTSCLVSVTNRNRLECHLWAPSGAWHEQFDSHVDAEVARIWDASFNSDGRSQESRHLFGGTNIGVRRIDETKLDCAKLQAEIHGLSRKLAAGRSPHVTEVTCALEQSTRLRELLKQRVKIGLENRAEKETRKYFRTQYKLEVRVVEHSDAVRCQWKPT